MSPIAYSTDRTFVAGETETAAIFNTYLRDNMKWLSTDAPCVLAYNNANISHSVSATYRAVTLNSERFDNATLHSTSSNTERITIPSGSDGKYIFGGEIGWASNATGIRVVVIALNGIATFLVGQYTIALTANAFGHSCSSMYSLAAADYINMCGFQNSGGALNMTVATNEAPVFWAYWARV